MAEGSEEERQGTGVVVLMLVIASNQEEEEEEEEEDLALSLARENTADTHDTWRLCRCSSLRDKGAGRAIEGDLFQLVPLLQGYLTSPSTPFTVQCVSRNEPRESFLSLVPCPASGSGRSLGRRHACSGSLALRRCFDDRCIKYEASAHACRPHTPTPKMRPHTAQTIQNI